MWKLKQFFADLLIRAGNALRRSRADSEDDFGYSIASPVVTLSEEAKRMREEGNPPHGAVRSHVAEARDPWLPETEAPPFGSVADRVLRARKQNDLR